MSLSTLSRILDIGFIVLSFAKVLDVMCKGSESLFLKSPMDFSKCTGMDHKVHQFMDRMKQQKMDDN